MAATTKNELIVARNPGDLMNAPVKSDANLYQGTLCYNDAGGGGATGVHTGNTFLGVVKHQRNRAGGDLREVEYYRRGFFTFPQNGTISQGDVGLPAHGINNFEVADTGGIVIGKIARFISASLAEIELT